MPGLHFPWSASAAYRNMACAGALALGRTIPASGSSVYAAQGTVAHDIVADMVRKDDSGGLKPGVVQCEGFDIVVDQDLITAIDVCTDYVRTNVRGDVLIEQFLPLAAYGLPIESGGTGDVIGYDGSQALLELVDHKFGAGQRVEVQGNLQLRHYALGALLLLAGRPVERVKITIIQPRMPDDDGEVIHSEEIDPVDLLFEFLPRLRRAMERSLAAQIAWTKVITEEGEADWSATYLNPGTHCTFCPAAGSCPALRDRALQVIKQNFDYFSEPIPLDLDITPEEMARDLDRIDLVEKWISARKVQAYSMVNRNIEIPGWRLVKKIGHRKWLEKDDFRASIAIAAALNLPDPDMLFERKLKTPAGVEKMRGMSKKKALIEDLYERPITGAELVRAGRAAKRQAADSLVNQFFQSLEEDATNGKDS